MAVRTKWPERRLFEKWVGELKNLSHKQLQKRFERALTMTGEFGSRDPEWVAYINAIQLMAKKKDIRLQMPDPF